MPSGKSVRARDPQEVQEAGGAAASGVRSDRRLGKVPGAGSASPELDSLDPVGRVAFYNVGSQRSQIGGPRGRQRLNRVAQDLQKCFVELSADMVCLSELGEVLVGLDAEFHKLEDKHGSVSQPAPGSVSQPALGAVERWLRKTLVAVEQGDWNIYVDGHYASVIRPDSSFEVESVETRCLYPLQPWRVAQVLSLCTRTVTEPGGSASQPALPGGRA